MRRSIDLFTQWMQRMRVMETSFIVSTASMTYSYYNLIDLESNCNMFSIKKEELLKLANGISNDSLSLDDEQIRKEIVRQLSFVEDVINFYCLFKFDRSIERFADICSVCNGIGFFSSSSILMGAYSKAVSANPSWYAMGFIFHFSSMLISIYVNEEVKIDKQWLAQLLLCYRSSLLRMILILDDDNAAEQQQRMSETKDILEKCERLLRKYDKNLDEGQIGEWLKYHFKNDVNMR